MENSKTDFYCVVTTIQSPTPSVGQLLKEGEREGMRTIVIGDRKGPFEYDERCIFLALEQQLKLPFRLAKSMPVDHYARKNIGYLEAIKRGAKVIYETDDDNGPISGLWAKRDKELKGKFISQGKWFNAYRYFKDTNIWPRGFPLDEIKSEMPDLSSYRLEKKDTPIQQGLHDGAPDVDAIWRLVQDREITFDKNKNSLILDHDTWAPFNSQSTWWFFEVFPLMYLPSTCTIRMTDIWRSFIAKRCLREVDMYVGYHGSEVFQDRNEHNLMTDFEHEMPGYLGYKKFVECLESLSLKPGFDNLILNMKVCYEALTEADFFDNKEIFMLEDWCIDLKGCLS